jgi:hypothetical protein
MCNVEQKPGAGVFSGLLFLALGVILLIGNLDLYPVRPLLSQWWPVLFIVLGLKSLLVYRGTYAWIGGLFWIGVGSLFLASTLGFLGIAVPTLIWPLILIWFGVYTIIGTHCERQTPEGGQS